MDKGKSKLTVGIFDVTQIDSDDYLGSGFAIIHISRSGIYRGLHYVENDHDGDNYLDYIAENDIYETDTIFYGYVEDYMFNVKDIIKK